MPQTFKLSDEQAAKYGIKTQDDLLALLELSNENASAAASAKTENAELTERLGAFEARVTSIETELKAKVLNQDEVTKAAVKAATTQASATASEILSKTGAPPVAPNATAQTEQKAEAPTFESKVREMVAGGMKKSEAITKAVKDYPDLHADYRERGSVEI